MYQHYSYPRYWAYLLCLSILAYFSHPLEQFFSFVTLNFLLGLFNLVQMNNYKLGLPLFIGPPEYTCPNKPEFKQLRKTWYAGYTIVFWCGIIIQLTMITVHLLT
ncbi:hypothetical protein C3B51_09110 [Pseudoalteromonas rubra]|uniref:Uncharacterized protein n=1 Tax=Pseudoalteromonas rubra TaxID=43658 RepID=A0A4Q7EDS6_9GAMM|nr:hypothetical protein C3B51_09110 [Pseudoalteromonas rubra]